MAGLMQLLLLTAALAAPGGARPHERDESVRDPQNFAIEGVESFDVADVKNALAADIDVQLAGHPDRPFAGFLEMVSSRILAGYHSVGFAYANVKVDFDPKWRRVSVWVTEGPQYRCGDVVVTGVDGPVKRALEKLLTEGDYSLYAVPVTRQNSDGTEAVVWEDSTGRRSKVRRPVWKAGEPAPLDKETGKKIYQWTYERLWAEGRVFGKAKIAFGYDQEKHIVHLKVDVTGAERGATVGQIQIEGLSANSREDVLQYLDLRSGAGFHWRLPTQLERRLWESGRFITPAVTALRPADSDSSEIDLRIVLMEHPHNPPLSAALIPEQQALLRMAQWLREWGAGDHPEDLIGELHVDGGPDEEEAEPRGFFPTVDATFVASSQHGQVASVALSDAEGKPISKQTFLARDGRLVLFSPMRRVRFEFEHSPQTQLLATVSLHAVPPDEEKHVSSIGYGLMAWTGPTRYSNLFELHVELDPAAVLSDARHIPRDSLRVEGRKLILEHRDDADEWRIAADERTGRILDARVHLQDGKGPADLRIRFENGALDRELERQNGMMAGSTNGFDPARPLCSFGMYALDVWREYALADLSDEDQASLAAVRKLLALWSPEPLGKLFAGLPLGASAEAFGIPAKEVRFVHPALAALNVPDLPLLAGHILPVYRRLVPQQCWLWPVGRELLFSSIARPDAKPQEEKNWRSLYGSGPLGHLVGALASAGLDPKLSQHVAADAARVLSTEAFRADLLPLLADDSWLGRNLLSLVDALRKLDEPEIRAVVRLLPDGAPYERITASVLMLKSDPRRKAIDVLPAILTGVWNSSIRAKVEIALKRIAAGNVPTPTRDGEVRPASGTSRDRLTE